MGMRPYQTSAIDQIQAHFRAGRRKVLLVMPTGSGKTHIFSDVITKTAAKGNPCVMVVRGRKLVDQASKRLAHENVDHGVLMSGHWRVRRDLPIQLASIDTCLVRQDFPEARLLVLDEAHLMVSPQSKRFIERYANQGAFILGVTATPWTKEPLNHLADVAVVPITMRELIDQGFLVPARYFAPSEPDMTGVRLSSNGDYNTSQSFERMGRITGDLVGHWKQFADGRKTLLFAVNVEHSKWTARLFNEAGIPWGHVDAKSSDKVRAHEIERLERGEIAGISNCGILCTGVDIPSISCIVFARPTKSLNLYLQIAGRGTRTHPGKQDFIILDHAANVREHGFITDDREITLNRRPKANPVRVRICKVCYLAFDTVHCPACGPVGGEKIERDPNHVDGVLEEISALTFDDEVRREIKRLKENAKALGYKRGWIFFELVKKYGEAVAEQHMPKRKVPSWVVTTSDRAKRILDSYKK